MKFINSIKLTALIGLSMLAISAQAQCDDSTCSGYPPPVTQSLTHTHTTPKGFFLSPDPIIKFNHRTFTCPNGYIGTDGTAGLITEEQKVTYYPNGQISYGEWHDLEDNCQEKPKTPPPPPPPPTITKNISGINITYNSIDENKGYITGFGFMGGCNIVTFYLKNGKKLTPTRFNYNGRFVLVISLLEWENFARIDIERGVCGS